LEKFDVLDKGFVILLDKMGSDEDIESAARVSYEKTRDKKDTERLLRYLYRHEHMSPFEMAELKFHIKIPLFVFGQMVRHRTANLNVRSYRYSEFIENEYYFPSYSRFKKQSQTNKQGSSNENALTPELYNLHKESQRRINDLQFEQYEYLISKGVAREIARIHLPQSIYTEVIWKMDLRNLLHFLKLRLGKGAQEEAQEYARAIAKCVEKHFPITWRAFRDYTLNGVALTKDELDYALNRIGREDLEVRGYTSREINSLEELCK